MKTASSRPRDRIVETSANLFYAHDAHTVGVDTICAVANVSKRTLYKHFPAKEALVSAALSKQVEWWFDEFQKIDAADPTERIMSVFAILQRNAGAKQFHGCPMMNTSVELRGSKAPAVSMAQSCKAKLYDYFRQQAALLGADEPDDLAQQLLVLFDGCNAWIVMRGQYPAAVTPAVRALIADSKPEA